MTRRRRGVALLICLLALTSALAAGAQDAMTVRGTFLEETPDPFAPLLQIRRGPFARLPAPSIGLDIGYHSQGQADGGQVIRGGLRVLGIADPQQDTQAKWSGIVVEVEVPPGNTANLSHLVPLVVHAFHLGSGDLLNNYGAHIVVGTRQNGGNILGTAYGTYTSVGAVGSAWGTIGTATAHYVSNCFRTTRVATIGRCIGLDIEPQTNGEENWAILSRGGKNELRGPLLLQLDGTVKQVTQGPPDSCGPGQRCLMVPN